MDSVRYAAKLDTGEGFLAFAGGYLITPTPILEVGEIELPEGRILSDGHEVWPFPKVRRMAPMEGEYVYLYDFVHPMTKMVTRLGDMEYLVVTDQPLYDAMWGGKVTEYAFDRAAYIEVALV